MAHAMGCILEPLRGWQGRFIVTPSFECTHSGAGFPSKETLCSAQNPENKGSEFFLPARSMVLKVVRGKIFKTWELSPDVSLESRVPVQVFKDRDYLVDNLYMFMLSELKAWVNKKAGGLRRQFQIGNLAGLPHLAWIRSLAAAMSAKSPALSQKTREGHGTRFCVW